MNRQPSRSRFVRHAAAAGLLVALSGVGTLAAAQTMDLTVHVTGDRAGVVRLASGGFGACTAQYVSCTFHITPGTMVRLSAAGTPPGRFSGGTGPAASCALSTCAFAMTAAAELGVTFSAADGPVATLTTTVAGDGGGTVTADGVPCAAGTCEVPYLAGSSAEIDADAAAAARFAGYSAATGAASSCGSASACTFTLSADASVAATFHELTSFVVTPSNATAAVGGVPQTFTVIGAYTDGATQPVESGRGAWSAVAPLPFPTVGPAVAALDGKVYAFGGFPVFRSGTLGAAYDPVAGTWSTVASMAINRYQAAAATAGGFIYVMGGHGYFGVESRVERYDPQLDAWTYRASMTTPRFGLAAGTIDGIIYAAGGGAPSTDIALATLEAYDPATDSWTHKTPMPTARCYAASGVIDGILYVVGGRDAATGTSWLSTVEAYDPATDTWSTKAPLPAPLSDASAAVADGVLYVMHGQFTQSVVYAYDPAADAWTLKAPLRAALVDASAVALDGIVYAIGGLSTYPECCSMTDTVQAYVDTLRWSSSSPAVARTTQEGIAMPLSAGTTTIVARIGARTCAPDCPVLTVVEQMSSEMSLDTPAKGSIHTAGASFEVGGWAINRGAPPGAGPGVDAIHVWAVPSGGEAIFVGSAAYGVERPDIAAIYGPQFRASGFTLAAPPLPAGAYMLVASAHNALTQQFDMATTVTIEVRPPASVPGIAVDTPRQDQVVASAFEIAGWAVDAGALTGTGVDAVHYYLFPKGGLAPGVFVGAGGAGIARPDVAARFGPRFLHSGYHMTVTGLAPGSYVLCVYARSTVTGSFSIVQTVRITASATALLSIDSPEAEVAIAASSFVVAGWSIDPSVEPESPSGTGIDMLHVYAYPDPGSGQPPIFLGVAEVGVYRPDVGGAYGSRYDHAGYTLTVDRAAIGLPPGVYDIVVQSHSYVSGTFSAVAFVRATLQ